MFTYSKEIRSFILGIIAWEILSMLLKCGYSESFSQEATSGFWSGVDVSGWGKEGADGDKIDSGSDISGAAAIFGAIDDSTKGVIANIEDALANYEDRAIADYGSVGSQYSIYHGKSQLELSNQQNLLSELGDVFKDAAKKVSENEEQLGSLLIDVQNMSAEGSSQIGSLKARIDQIQDDI